MIMTGLYQLKNMNFNFFDYCQYLLKSHTNFTITNLANHLENIIHDTINRYLRYQSLNSEDLWRNVKEEFVSDTEAYLIFDDTVINNKLGYNIELTRRQYSGNEHQVVCVPQSCANLVQEQFIVYILILKINNYGLQIIEFMTQILTRKQKQIMLKK